MPLKEEELDDLGELLKRVVEIARRGPEGGFLWFRGAACSAHPLLPKIMRDGKEPEDVFDRERRLITRFRQRSMPYWNGGHPQSDWEHLFAMQHYGMPTRLLDWSENLFVAAYFALHDNPTHDHEGDCVPTVWCLDPVQWNQATPPLAEYGKSIQVLTTADDEIEAFRPDTQRRRMKSPVAIYGAHNSTRIVAQRGTFLVWGNEAIPLEEVADESDCVLWKLVLRGSRSSLAADLRHLGFGETMIFPELPYLGKELTRSEGWRGE